MAWVESYLKGGSSVSWTKTPLYTGGTLSDTEITLSSDYHNYDLIEFTCQNSASGIPSSFITTPEILDSMFQYSTYACLNEFYSNQYCCYSKISNTSLAKKAAYRSLYVTDVYGFKCNGTVTKTTLYERQGYSTSSVTITGTDFLKYDYIFFSTCTGSNDETVICTLPFQCGTGRFSTTYNTFLANFYNHYFSFKITNTSIDTSTKWFMVQGIKIE